MRGVLTVWTPAAIRFRRCSKVGLTSIFQRAAKLIREGGSLPRVAIFSKTTFGEFVHLSTGA